MLQRKPEHRYATAADVEVELRAGLAGLGVPYGAREALEEVLYSLTGAPVPAPRAEQASG